MDGMEGGGRSDARSVSALRAVFESGPLAKDSSLRQELLGRPDEPATKPPVLLVRKPDAAAAQKQGPVALKCTSGAPTPLAQWKADGGGSGAVEHGDAAGTAAEPNDEWPLLNTDGNAVALGRHPDFKSLYYCGQERPIPGSDGFCGPDDGPQCNACKQLQKEVPPTKPAVRATDGWSILSIAPGNLQAASVLPQDLSLAGTLEAGRDCDVDILSMVNSVGNSMLGVGDQAMHLSAVVRASAEESGSDKLGGHRVAHGELNLWELDVLDGNGLSSSCAPQTQKTKVAASELSCTRVASQSPLLSPPATSPVGDGSPDLDILQQGNGAPKRMMPPNNSPVFHVMPPNNSPVLPITRSFFVRDGAASVPLAMSTPRDALPCTWAPPNTPNALSLAKGHDLPVPERLPAVPLPCNGEGTLPQQSPRSTGGPVASEVGKSENTPIPGEILALYEELTEDAKSFAVALMSGPASAAGGAAATGEVVEAGGANLMLGKPDAAELTSGEARTLCEELVERWIREQMLREGRKAEDIEKERELVKEGREGERKEEGLERGGVLAGGGSDGAAGREREGKEEEEVAVTPLRASRGDVNRDDEEQGEGGLWWGARLWEEEAADDECCNAPGIINALSQLLRSNVCLYGQLFAARALPVLAARASCKPEVAGNVLLMAAAAGALRNFCKAVSSAAESTSSTGSTDSAGEGEGVGRRLSGGSGASGERERERAEDKAETRRIEQRERVGLGGALHLSLGLLKLARLGPATSELMLESNLVPALCQALALRISNPGGARVHEAAALAAGVLASNISASASRVEALAPFVETLVKVCGHTLRHVQLLSRPRERGVLAHGGVQHKQLVAASRVVAASGVGILILRDLAHSAPTKLNFSVSPAVLSKIEMMMNDVLSHVLHGLKSVVYMPGNRTIAASAWGWRTSLFLTAIRAAMLNASLDLISRLREPELVQMLVALAVQDDTQGGAGTPTQSTHMDHDRRDEEQEVRAMSQSILLGCMQQTLPSLHALGVAPAPGVPCASKPCEAASRGGGRDVGSVEVGGGELGTSATLSMEGGDDVGEEERRECRREQQRMLKAVEKAVQLAIQSASSQAASLDAVRRPLHACSTDETASEASRRGVSLMHLLRSLVPASPAGQAAAESSSGHGRGMHGDSGGVLPRTGVESDSAGGSSIDSEESSSAAAKLLAVAASLRESSGSRTGDRQSPVRGFAAAQQGPTPPGTPGVAVRHAFLDAPLYEGPEHLRAGREQPGVVEENPGWALAQIDSRRPGYPDSPSSVLAAAAVPGSPDSTRRTPYAGRNGTVGGDDTSSQTQPACLRVCDDGSLRLVHQRLV